nr:MAG TPA: hypothetical protein [Caudoviricetes sp.]
MSTIPWSFFMSIHMNDCSCVHSCVASVELSMVRTIGAYTAHTEHHCRYIIYFT